MSYILYFSPFIEQKYPKISCEYPKIYFSIPIFAKYPGINIAYFSMRCAWIGLSQKYPQPLQCTVDYFIETKPRRYEK